jgi:hypothetical protein
MEHAARIDPFVDPAIQLWIEVLSEPGADPR